MCLICCVGILLLCICGGLGGLRSMGNSVSEGGKTQLSFLLVSMEVQTL